MKVLVNDEGPTWPTTSRWPAAHAVRLPGQGIAVAVDWAVIPRSQWNTLLREGSRVEW